jgi:chromosomal replication initiation ATPase DnaA
MAVAEVMGVRLTQLCSEMRGDAKVAFARQTAMYLCHLVFALRASDIATAFGRDRSTAAHAIARIEEARENPEVDRRLYWLEAALRRAGGFYG